MSANTDHITLFYPVQVTVVQNAGTGEYEISCVPENLTITHDNSVITYQLVSAPAGVEFWSLEITETPVGPNPGKPQRQFKPPQISAQNRMLAIDDINREKKPQSYSVFLQLSCPDGSQFKFDPQIINRPG